MSLCPKHHDSQDNIQNQEETVVGEDGFARNFSNDSLISPFARNELEIGTASGWHFQYYLERQTLSLRTKKGEWFLNG